MLLMQQNLPTCPLPQPCPARVCACHRLVPALPEEAPLGLEKMESGSTGAFRCPCDRGGSGLRGMLARWERGRCTGLEGWWGLLGGWALGPAGASHRSALG